MIIKLTKHSIIKNSGMTLLPNNLLLFKQMLWHGMSVLILWTELQLLMMETDKDKYKNEFYTLVFEGASRLPSKYFLDGK